jgi:hypothetical protein
MVMYKCSSTRYNNWTDGHLSRCEVSHVPVPFAWHGRPLRDATRLPAPGLHSIGELLPAVLARYQAALVLLVVPPAAPHGLGAQPRRAWRLTTLSVRGL